MAKHNLNCVLLLVVSFLVEIESVIAQDNIEMKLAISWRPAPEYNTKENLGLQFVLKNVSKEPISLKSWDLWFNSMYPIVEIMTDSYRFTNESGNLYKLQFSDQYIAPNDSLVFEYQTLFPISNISTVPNGFYLQDKIDKNNYFALNKVDYKPVQLGKEQLNHFYANLYDKNDRLNMESEYSLVFPTPKSLVKGDGFLKMETDISFYVDYTLYVSDFLIDQFESVFGKLRLSTNVKGAYLQLILDQELELEAYRLKINKQGVQIYASSSQGIFYAIQSLKSILSVNNLPAKSLPYLEIEDEPRFGYRGFMLDIVRNFKSKETIMKYLDIMSMYKLNVFHFHLIDDEGWRVEIDGLPELVEVGARRSPLFANGQSLMPAYGSGANDTERHYLTRSDFIEILKYAKDRNIKVIPEIETPGHARAAIKSMEARYHRLMSLGQIKEAEEYLLHDFEDLSEYNSAQNFNDNILNPALPSVYRFIDKVLDEFKSMYAEAGVEFTLVSLGGDEVPNGVWEKSPKIKELMKSKGFTTVYQVWSYYIKQINEICLSKGLKMAGWEEIGMVNKGKGMVVNADFPNKKNMLLDVWNNVIGGGQEDLAYRLANAGYPVVLLSSSNMYFDMMWNTNFNEPGLKWATYADLYHSYSLLPEDYFANIDTYYSGKALGKEGFKNRERLTDLGKQNLIGIKGGLFAETVDSDSKLDYLVFPRFFTLAERAWSAKREYESESSFTTLAFDRDYIQFINRIGEVELPRLKDLIEYRLPAVGIKNIDGRIFANVEYANYTIYYTEDGSTPSLMSKVCDSKNGVIIKEGSNYVFTVIDDQGRLGQLSFFSL